MMSPERYCELVALLIAGGMRRSRGLEVVATFDPVEGPDALPVGSSRGRNLTDADRAYMDGLALGFTIGLCPDHERAIRGAFPPGFYVE